MVLDEPRGQRHRGQRHRNAVCLLREQLFRHHRPGRTAGRRHERQLFGDLLDEVLRLLRRTQVGADRDLDDVGEAELLHRGAQLARRNLGAELTDERRRYGSVNALACLNRSDHLEDLRLVRDRAERAVDQTLSAGNALVVINIRAAVLVRVDSVHAAGRGARALLMVDGLVRAYIDAAAALDALILIDDGLAGERVDGDRALRADLDARTRHAALAHIGHADLIFRAGVAGKLDDVDERRGVVGLLLGRRVDVVGQRRMLSRAAARQTHRQTQAFAYDRALQKNILAIGCYLARHDVIRQRLDAAVGRPLGMVRHTRDLGKNTVSNVSNSSFHASHEIISSLCVPCNHSYPLKSRRVSKEALRRTFVLIVPSFVRT